VRLAVPPVEGEDWLDALKRLGPEEVGRLLQGAPEVEASEEGGLEEAQRSPQPLTPRLAWALARRARMRGVAHE
jgi:putative DNA primase/helicase